MKNKLFCAYKLDINMYQYCVCRYFLCFLAVTVKVCRERV